MEMPNDIRSEISRLHAMGFALHFIRKNSKAPVGKWGEGEVKKTKKDLEAEYKSGYGLGVRLGAPSRFLDGTYLANIDIDIKSKEPHHRLEALKEVDRFFPGFRYGSPLIETGYGQRLLVRTKKPLRSFKVAESKELAVVYMPSDTPGEPNKQQIAFMKKGLISREQLEKGYRVRPAWQIEFMSRGDQVVLPPSIHPDTGKAYRWGKSFSEPSDIPRLKLKDIERLREALGEDGDEEGEKEKRSDHELAKPPQKQKKLELGNAFPSKALLKHFQLSSELKKQIKLGEGVINRSDSLFSVIKALVRARVSDLDILTILTNRKYYLGEVAYDHAKTKNRRRAAQWIAKYGLKKARAFEDPSEVFSANVDLPPKVSGEQLEQQIKDLSSDGDWQRYLSVDKHGIPKPTLLNTVLVLQNQLGKDVFKRDLFSLRDYYGRDTPWGAKPGTALVDEDAVRVKVWLARNYKFEPPRHVVEEAITKILQENGFHPIKDFIETLPDWDGKERLPIFLKKHWDAKEPEHYLSEVFTKWMVAAIARIYNPGMFFKHTLIFQGRQNAGKSSFGRLLFGEKYFLDWLPPLHDKDAAMALQGHWVIEFGELSTFRRSTLEAVKAYISRPIDKIRPAFNRRWVELPRQCVFYGTSNELEIFADETGNVRFWPVTVGQLDWDALKRDRLQLWAEAYFIYRNKLYGSLDLSEPAKATAEEISESRKVIGTTQTMQEIIGEYMRKQAETEANAAAIPGIMVPRLNFKRFKLHHLFELGSPLERYGQSRQNEMHAANALRNLGAEKTRHGVTGNWWGFGITLEKDEVKEENLHKKKKTDKSHLELLT